MKMIFTAVLGVLAGILAAAGCSPVTIGTFATAPRLSSYEEYSRYAESIDGFVQDSAAALKADTLLLQALEDCNVPIGPEGKELRERAKVYRHAKELMDSIIVLDTHCDFPESRHYHPEKFGNFGDSRSYAQVTLEKMRQGHLGAECMVVFMSPLYDDQFNEKGIEEAPAKMWEFIDEMSAHFREYGDECGIARNSEEVRQLRSEGKRALLYCLENGYWIGRDLSNLARLKDLGFVYITLSHFGDNIICNSSNRTADQNGGLTEFGRQVVREMNRLGIIVDLSHTSFGTWRDVLAVSSAPVVFTHSGAAAVYQNPRNVDDETLRLLAANGGVIQLHMVRSFMAPKGKRDGVGLTQFMEHLEHLIAVAGVDHVGIGLDFDGGGGGAGLDGANDIINITVELLNRGYSDSNVTKILGGNFLRVLDQVQGK